MVIVTNILYFILGVSSAIDNSIFIIVSKKRKLIDSLVPRILLERIFKSIEI